MYKTGAEILSLESLKIGFTFGRNRKILLPLLNGTAARGEMIALVGRNGIGKSTLLRTIIGLLPSCGGKITLNGKDVSEYSRLEMARVAGFISTELVMVRNMRVKDLVALGRFPHTNWTGRLTPNDREVIDRAIDNAGISGLGNRFIAELSDGERQRSNIARVLAQNAGVMIMDEPTAFLDITSRFEIVHLMHELAAGGKTILFSTHDLNIALNWADKVWLLLDSGILEGAPEDLMIRRSFDNLFTGKPVMFNFENGTFSYQVERRGEIYIEGTGNLRYWTEKAVSRAGLSVSETKTATYIKIPSKAHNKWLLITRDDSLELNSLYELVKLLEGKSG